MPKKQKRSWGRIALAELIFWLHTLVLVAVVVSGLFIDWWWVLIIIAILRIQVHVLHGCILTILEDHERGYGKQVAYFKIAWRRFFGVNLNKRGVWWASAGQILLAVGIATIATIWHIRLHI